MISFPNQNMVKINKPKYKRNFLQIGIDEWQEASKVLTPSAFKIYLYLASNMNGFDLALSKQDIKNQLGISFTRFYEAISLLKKTNYLKENGKNRLQFFVTPNLDYKDSSEIHNWESPETDSGNPSSEHPEPKLEQNSPVSNIEIDKKDKINKTYNPDGLFLEKWSLAEELEGILFNKDIDDDYWKTITEIVDVDAYSRIERFLWSLHDSDLNEYRNSIINYVCGLIDNLNPDQRDTIARIVKNSLKEKTDEQ